MTDQEITPRREVLSVEERLADLEVWQEATTAVLADLEKKVGELTADLAARNKGRENLKKWGAAMTTTAKPEPRTEV